MAANLRPSGQVRLTERDHALIGFAAEHRLVLERQLERLAGARRHTLEGRLRALVRGEYLTSGRVFQDRYFQVRRGGLAAIGSGLKAPDFKLGSYKHDIGVAWLWLAARGGTFGSIREVIGERRLRSYDGALDHPPEPYGVRLGGFDRYGNERLHYPDLLLIDPQGRRLALELELSSKGRAKRELILGGYAADGRVSRVLYLVEANAAGRGIRRSVESATRDLGLTDRVRFQLIKEIRVAPAAAPRHRFRAAPTREAETAR